MLFAEGTKIAYLAGKTRIVQMNPPRKPSRSIAAEPEPNGKAVDGRMRHMHLRNHER